ncbi:MAG: hypothetical protein ACRETT_15705, partial [Steroidobacteraceae bacterium]
MTSIRTLTVVALAGSLALGACSRKPASEPGAAPQAAATPAAPVEGAPRIATAPDGVHIEYRVYGTGDPAVVLVH